MSKELPRTAKGRRTRAAIVDAAASMMYTHGVAGTTLDDVLAASETGKSQLYHYFSDKSDLVEAVIARQLERVLAAQPRLANIDSLADIDAWAAEIVRNHEQPGGPFSCPLGSLAAELKNDAAFVPSLYAAFRRWEQPLEQGLRRMVDRGELDVATDPAAAAATLIASLQGGMLIARIAGDVQPLRDTLDAAVSAVGRRRTRN
ncbi:TetR/AcrR family transcriptional regulator [Rhodococcoides yunnanense]|uniref:TetR/AcrR family transcriptional regulator n=1 Tax=Rhodococcoides yunnanense TaxID=278209 RepID=A0ABU4BFW4_9NOCA|nr:TetR/AcrR family transcriptional regulator [Rhodococcus yunnanensis]MDV6263095.1 TetR/AcrR family transcriptional regulator [Rhodococcus yunnanensis]